MAKVKFEVIRDDENKVDGYRLGNWYLMKIYWGFGANDYSWIINRDGKRYYSTYEYNLAWDKGNLETVCSCRDGKQRLLELNGLA